MIDDVDEGRRRRRSMIEDQSMWVECNWIFLLCAKYASTRV
jgi:hypothetical protein